MLSGPTVHVDSHICRSRFGAATPVHGEHENLRQIRCPIIMMMVIGFV